MKIFIIIIFIMSLIYPSNASEWRKVEFGFNLGYVNDIFHFKTAVLEIKKHGIRHIRVYEPFSKVMNDDSEKVYERIEYLVKNDFTILLSLSNFPYQDDFETLSSKDHSTEIDKKSIFKYSNRFPPRDIGNYRLKLINFMENLKKKKLLSKMEFEIFNEPDAPKYFWGNVDDYKNIKKIIYNVISKYERPIYCCGFTSDLFFNEKKNERQKQFFSSIKHDELLYHKKYNLSFHLYFDDFENSLATPPLFLENSIISEFNLYSFIKEKGKKDIEINSEIFPKKLSALIFYAYRNKIERIYLFALMDHPNKQYSLGFFHSNGKPKPVFKHFLGVYNVVKYGFIAFDTEQGKKLVGRKDSLIIDTKFLNQDK